MAPGANEGHIPKPDMNMQSDIVNVLSMLDSKGRTETSCPKRYALYCGKERQGGHHDFHSSSDSYEDLMAEVRKLNRRGSIDWWEVVDRANEKVVDSSGG